MRGSELRAYNFPQYAQLSSQGAAVRMHARGHSSRVTGQGIYGAVQCSPAHLGAAPLLLGWLFASLVLLVTKLHGMCSFCAVHKACERRE